MRPRLSRSRYPRHRTPIEPRCADGAVHPSLNPEESGKWRAIPARHAKRFTFDRVSWAVEDLINEAAQQTLVDLKELDALDDDGKKQALDKIKAWCAAHAGKSAADLLAETISTSKNQDDFLKAARKALALKQPQLIASAVARTGDFPKIAPDIAQLALLSGSPAFVEQARAWLKANPPSNTPGHGPNDVVMNMNVGGSRDADEIRFWSALILVRDGDHAKDEGLDVLRDFLDKDDGTFYYPHAIPTLLATKNEKLMALACGVLKKPGILNWAGDGADQIRRFFLAGRPECRDFLIAELKNTSPGQETQFVTGPNGQTATEHPPASQGIVDIICRWRKDDFRIDESASPSENLKKRRELEDWINAQFALIQQGKTPDMRTDVSDNVPRWQIDEP
jgi:hypothetical protein